MTDLTKRVRKTKSKKQNQFDSNRYVGKMMIEDDDQTKTCGGIITHTRRKEFQYLESMLSATDASLETSGRRRTSIKTKRTVEPIEPIEPRPRPRLRRRSSSRMTTTHATIILLSVLLLSFVSLDISVSVHAENVQEVGQTNVGETEAETEETNDSNNDTQKRRRRQSRRHRKRNRRKLTNQRIDCESDCLLGIHHRGLSSLISLSGSGGGGDSRSGDETKIEIGGGTTMYREEAMNCIFHCMSPECYVELYGGGRKGDGDNPSGAQKAGGSPLEPGEIDIGRYIEFERCIDEQLLQAKIAARTATATVTTR